MFKYYQLIFLVYFSIVHAQYDQHFEHSSYYDTKENKLNVKFEIDNDIESFKFDDGITSYEIVPNTSLRTSISANSRFLTLRIGYTPVFLANNNSEQKGKTKVFKVNLDLFMHNWMQSFNLSSVKGYYIDNLNDPNSNFIINTDEFVILPNLKTFRIIGTTRYKFNKNLSFKAIFNQYDVQRKSTGSFIPTLNYQFLRLNDNSNPQDLRSFDLILNAGYFYTFVIDRKWYANLGLSPGLGIEFNKLKTKNDNISNISKSQDFIFNVNTFIGLGYNSKNFFSGINLRGIATTRDDKSLVQFNTVRGVFQFFIGYRFDSPKFISNSFDWIENQIPDK